MYKIAQVVFGSPSDAEIFGMRVARRILPTTNFNQSALLLLGIFSMCSLLHFSLLSLLHRVVAVEAVFFEFDDDHDGRVNFSQFERLWLRGA